MFTSNLCFAQQKINVDEVQKHVGEKAIIVGKVSQITTTNKGQILIRIKGNNSNNSFMAVIFPKDTTILLNPKQLENKTIEISGRIINKNGKFQIVIKHAEQIKEIEERRLIPQKKTIAEIYGISFETSLTAMVLFIVLFLLVLWHFKTNKNLRLFQQKSGEQETAFNSLNEQYDLQKNTYNLLYEKYKDIIDLDSTRTEKERETKKLNEYYLSKKRIYDRLMNEIKMLVEDKNLTEFGLYNAHFNFDTSEEYKNKLEQNGELQKVFIKEGKAIICKTQWTVSNSIVQGRVWTKKQFKLMLRAFNGECDAGILKVRWNNIKVMEERIKRSFDAINKLGLSSQITLTKEYLGLKMDELHLSYELQEKLHEEKEQQRQIREMMREEEKVQQEIELAIKESEDEEKVYKSAIEKAKEEVEKATGEQLNNLNTRIADLEKQLKEAIEKKERALSRAQLTKSGHVYIISNIGSFGENVYKIGMTRRLDPMDRVRELGDASVPFSFDVHAIIYSDDAPELEKKLQKAFERKRVNMVNYRKEYFNASLDEIEKEVNESYGKIEFVKLPEARQFRETKKILNVEKPLEVIEENKFPDSLI